MDTPARFARFTLALFVGLAASLAARAADSTLPHLEKRGVPTLFRIHESPDPAKVEIFEEFISTLGYSLSGPADSLEPRNFQRLVERIRGKPEEKPIAFLMLRTMQKARYDPENLGHFGLAAESYTHFTSPIRRYPDLVVHRTLRESRHGLMNEERKAELIDDLPEVARHTSERERRADDAACRWGARTRVSARHRLGAAPGAR